MTLSSSSVPAAHFDVGFKSFESIWRPLVSFSKIW